MADIDPARIAEVEDVDETVIKASLSKGVKNVREVSDYSNYGIDSRPVKGLKCILLSLRNKAYKIFLGIKRQTVDRIAKPGETRLYNQIKSQVYLKENGDVVIESSSEAIITVKGDGTIVVENPSGATINMNTDGIIEINGNAKSAMTFEDFEGVWNDFITHYKLHSHPNGNLGTPTLAFDLPAIGSAEEDMTPAKSLKVKLGEN